MFENLDISQKKLIYLGLKKLIESGDGTGFHNCDPGHPIYLQGADGKTSDISKSQDNAETNDLFKILSALRFGDSGSIRGIRGIRGRTTLSSCGGE